MAVGISALCMVVYYGTEQDNIKKMKKRDKRKAKISALFNQQMKCNYIVKLDRHD